MSFCSKRLPANVIRLFWSNSTENKIVLWVLFVPVTTAMQVVGAGQPRCAILRVQNMKMGFNSLNVSVETLHHSGIRNNIHILVRECGEASCTDANPRTRRWQSFAACVRSPYASKKRANVSHNRLSAATHPAAPLSSKSSTSPLQRR